MKRVIFGYKNLHDIVTTLFSKNVSYNIISAFWVWMVTLAGFVYHSKELVLALLLLMLADWITGVWKSVRVGTFNSYTFQRMLLNIPLKFGMIAFAYQISLHSWIFNFLQIPEILMTGFLITEFVSLVENVRIIDSRIIPDALYNRLKVVMNLDAVIAAYLRPKALATVEAVAADPGTGTESPTEPGLKTGEEIETK